MPPIPSESKQNVTQKSFLGIDDDGNFLYHSALKDTATNTLKRNIQLTHEEILLKVRAKKKMGISQRKALRSKPYFMGNITNLYHLIHTIAIHSDNCKGRIRTRSRGFVTKNLACKVLINCTLM
jgi:hypothetical protein